MSDGLLHSTFAQAFDGAPDLYNTPSLAFSAAQSGDPTATGQALVQLNTAVAVDNVSKKNADDSGDQQPHHWWEKALHAVGTAPVIGPALSYAAKPLGAVTHEYRYLKDVYHNHGFWAGFGETIAMTAAGVIATVATGSPQVGILAAEGVGRLEGQFLYHDSWKRSQNAYGSFGRDIAHGLGFDNTDHGWGAVVSGGLDAGFDLTLDPLVKVGGLAAERKVAEPFARNYRVLGRKIGSQQASTNTFMQKVLRAPGLNASNPETIDAAWKNYGSYRRAAADIAKLNAGDIVTHYGTEMGPLSAELGAAKTAEQVHNVFKDAAFQSQMDKQLRTGILPTRTVMRVKANKVFDALAGDVALKDRLPLVAGIRRETQMTLDPAGNPTLKTLNKFQRGLAFHPMAWTLGATKSSRDLWVRAAATKIRTFSGAMPFSVDDNLATLSSKQVNLADDSNLKTLLDTARFALGERTARKWVDNFTQLRDANGVIEPALRRRAYGELLPEILKAAGMVNDPEAVAYLTKWSRHLAAGGTHTTAFSHGRLLGDKTNMVEGKLGESTERMALQYYQGDLTVTLPNFRQLKRAMRDSAHYTSWYGKLDDLAAHYYTNTFFKPLALLTWGFGIRIAAAEAIPGTFRYGAMNMLKGRVAATAAKLKYRLDAGEDGQIITAAAKAAGGVDRLLNDEFSRDLALRMVMENEGHIARGVAAAGHSGYSRPDNAEEDVTYGADQSGKRDRVWRGKVKTGNFRLFTDGGDPQYVDAWHHGLTHSANEYSIQLTAGDVKDALDRGMSLDAAQDFATKREAQRIRGIDPETGVTYAPGKDPYVTERKVLRRYGKQDPDVFATHRVDGMLGQVTGRDGTLHNDLLNHFVHGDDQIKISTLRNIDPAKRPAGVHGEVLEPFTPLNAMSAVINSGFKRVIDPTINYLSREPIYFNEMKKQWSALQPAIKKGILTEDSAFRLAQTRAVRGILPQIHNTALRSQFAMMATNLMPFYFAQEQALKRAGHLIRLNPAAFRKYQMEVQALHDPGFIQTDQSGNRHLVVPLLGEFGANVMNGLAKLHLPIVGGLPMSVSGDMASLDTVLPEAKAPSFSPFGAVALSQLANLDPAMAPAVSKFLGRGYNEPLVDAIIPNGPIRNAYKAWSFDERDRANANALLTATAAAYYHGQLPDPATATAAEMHRAAQKLRNNARSMVMVKAFLSSISPLSPSVQQEDAGFRDEWLKLVQNGDYEKALQTFLKEHGKKAISYTVAHTSTPTGASLPYTQAVFDYINAHGPLTQAHPWGAAFAAPQYKSKDTDGLVVYNELLRTGLAERRDPEAFQNAIYVAAGMQDYIAGKKAYLEAQQGLDPKSQAATDLSKSWTDWKQHDFRIQQPLAYDHLFGTESTDNANKAYIDIVHMFNDGSAPQTDQSAKLLGLTQDYERMKQALARFGDGTGDRTMSSQRQGVRDSWAKYLDDTANSDPTLQNVITAVFERLEA